MKKLLSILPLLWALSASAQLSVQFDFASCTTLAEPVRALTLYPFYVNAINPGGLTVADYIQRYTGTNGSVTISNVVPGTYYAVFSGTTTQQTNWFTFPATNGLIIAEATNSNGTPAYMLSTTIFLGSTVPAWSQTQSDLRYFRINGSPSNTAILQISGGGTNNSFTNPVISGEVSTSGTLIGPVLTGSTIQGSTSLNGVFSGNMAGNPGLGASFGSISGNALGLTNSTRGLGAINYVSGAGTGNIFNDIQTAVMVGTNEIAIAEDGSELAMWGGMGNKNGLVGSNAWGFPIQFPGGISYFGNPLWRDITNGISGPNVGSYAGFYWGYGPYGSSIPAAFPSGQNGVGGSVQPGLQVYNANPNAGITWIGIHAAQTNASFGLLAGTNISKQTIYVQQYGMELGAISQAYTPTTNSQGQESQQAPSFQCPLIGDSEAGNTEIDTFVSYNGQRTALGDTLLGQIPLVCYQPNLTAYPGWTNPAVRFPLQTGMVWMPTNANWRDALLICEGTGIVQAYWLAVTNRAHFGPNAFFNGSENCGVEILTNVAIENDNSAFTWDAGGNARLGVVKKNGQYPSIIAGSTSPIQFGHSSVATLQDTGNPVTSQTLTFNMAINSDGSVNHMGNTVSNVTYLQGTGAPALYFTSNNTAAAGSIFSDAVGGLVYVRSNSAWYKVQVATASGR